MIGYYNYTVILTYIGAFFGFVGMSFVLSGNLKMALMCLIFAGFCDLFDGRIASTLKTRTREAKRFGIQIDSLSDVICFGVLPALIVFEHSTKNYLYGIISAVYMICALIRLAWFNVDEEERQTREDGCRESYLGLPVTTSALSIPLFMGLGHFLKLDFANVYPWILLAIGVAFITPFHLKKPKFVGKLIMLVLGAACLTLVLVGVPS